MPKAGYTARPEGRIPGVVLQIMQRKVTDMEKRGPYRDPETIEDLHRPPGSPMPREAKSQKAQLESSHRHGTSKDVKVGLSYKTGQKPPKD